MSTTGHLQSLYQHGINWDRAAGALARIGSRGAEPESADEDFAIQAAVDSCRQVRAALLDNPEGPVPRAFLTALRTKVPAHAVAELLEHLASTLTRLKDSPVEVAAMPRGTMARIGEFLSESGQAMLRRVATRQPA
jgi:hypothetical protein